MFDFCNNRPVKQARHNVFNVCFFFMIRRIYYYAHPRRYANGNIYIYYNNRDYFIETILITSVMKWPIYGWKVPGLTT